eukprot:9351723-Pyramimonas_sp.AAC.1
MADDSCSTDSSQACLLFKTIAHAYASLVHGIAQGGPLTCLSETSHTANCATYASHARAKSSMVLPRLLPWLLPWLSPGGGRCHVWSKVCSAVTKAVAALFKRCSCAPSVFSTSCHATSTHGKHANRRETRRVFSPKQD